MLKLYKKDNKENLLYAEYWINDKNIAILHTGEVGKKGETKEYNLSTEFGCENEFLCFFKEQFISKGYNEISNEKTFLLVVQFPMKSLKGNKRDNWLKDKVMDCLNSELGWKGIGHVDGFDMGKQILFPEKFVLNIFCVVVDEDKGIKAIKRCLREYRLDYTRIKIASSPYLSDEEFQLKYSAKKSDQTFNL